jgi:hypothetical protein
MSRISNDLAQQIAFKLTEKSKKVMDEKHIAFRDLVTTLYEESTPALIIDALKKFPDWIDTCSSIRLNGHGFNYEYVTPTRKCVSNSSVNSLELTQKMADKITSVRKVWEKSKKQYNDLKDEVKHALLSLKTFANIRKELPAAAEYLPPPMSNALVVNLGSLNKRLTTQPGVKKEAAEEKLKGQ